MRPGDILRCAVGVSIQVTKGMSYQAKSVDTICVRPLEDALLRVELVEDNQGESTFQWQSNFDIVSPISYGVNGTDGFTKKGMNDLVLGERVHYLPLMNFASGQPDEFPVACCVYWVGGVTMDDDRTSVNVWMVNTRRNRFLTPLHECWFEIVTPGLMKCERRIEI